LTVGHHLSNDYLDRIEQAAPGIVGQKNEDLMISSHPFLRSVWTWNAEPRSWCGSISDLVQRGAKISDEFLAEVESEVHPADPMVFVYSSGSTSDPKAAVHSHGATATSVGTISPNPHSHTISYLNKGAGRWFKCNW